MTPEAAQTIASFLLKDLENEMATTLRVLAAVPTDRLDYSPSEKCMTAMKLAWHIASADLFFLDGIVNGQFARGESSMPESIKNAQDVHAWYTEQMPKGIERVRGLSAEQLANKIDFFGMMTAPAVVYLQLCIKHSVHHRGQLSSYLRPMGAKVPGIYGPSGDSQ